MRRFVIVSVILLSLAGCRKEAVIVPKQAPQQFQSQKVAANAQQRALEQFMTQQFVKKDGVVTSLGRVQVSGDVASGQDYLSESTGLWLLHLAATHQFDAFRTFYAASKKVLYTGQQFSYRLTRPSGKRSTVNASVDDLRIMRALLAYDEATGGNHYRDESATLFAQWAKGCLANGRLKDFYDVRYRKANEQASLAYFDLQTLRYFQNETDVPAYKEQVAIVQHGYLGDAFPLYAANYNYANQAYSSQDLNTSEALETLLQLARVGKLKSESQAWLVHRLERADLPNAMATNGGVVDKGQSVGSWALLAQIFATQHDAQHYDQTMALIWREQVQHGKLAGGFGDPKTGTAYSYTNLNVLLAADMRGQAHAND